MSTIKCVLVSIAKGEKLYIEEFCSYYFKLGFANLFLYDNSDNNELAYLIKKDPRIVVIHFPGPGKQISAYNHFIQNFKDFYDYVAFFDIDEFLVLKKHTNVKDFCLEYIPNGALGVNWYIFGNNYKEKYENDLVIRRFTRRCKTMDPHVKTIAKCADLKCMVIHHPSDLSGKSFYNTKKKPIQGPFNYDTDDSIVQLNHYWTKSDEELVNKVNRGRATTVAKRKLEDLKPFLKMNDVEDTSAIDFYCYN